MIRQALAVLTSVCCLASVTACTDSVDGTSGASAPLRLALARIAATDNTRGYLRFDDTARLVALSGHEWTGQQSRAFADLRAQGAPDLMSYGAAIADRPGIALLDASYTITAGQPPHQVGLLAGGQDRQRITNGLTGLGWRQAQAHLLAPGIANYLGDEATAGLVLPLARVSVTESDLAYGGAEARLDQVGAPSGPTLADDPLVSALADCLGDVVATTVATPTMHGTLQPSAVAVGVRAPAEGTGTPHVLACLSWPSTTDARRYRDLLDKALRDGASIVSAKPWKDILPGAITHDLDGDQHIVAWETDLPGPASRALKMLDNLDLPAFPCTPKMPPALRAAFAGYC